MIGPAEVCGQWLKARTDSELMIVALFCRPLDFPNHYVLRAQYAASEVRLSELAIVCESEATARSVIARFFPWLTWLARCPNDVPQLLGTWL